MAKATVKSVVFRVIAWALCIVWLGFCISQFIEQKATAPEVCNINEIDLSQDGYIDADIVYIDELYVLNRYVSVTSSTDSNDNYVYYLGTSTDYPKSDDGLLDQNPRPVNFERYTVMFYDSTGTPFVTSLESDTDDISILLGDAGGKPVKISLYAEVNGEFASPGGFEKYRSEVNELKEKSLTACAKENNAQIADYRLSEEKYPNVELMYLCETQAELEENFEFDAGFSFVFTVWPSVVGIILLIIGIVGRKKQRKPGNVAQKSE